jgi:type I restriction enzyme, S subunit
MSELPEGWAEATLRDAVDVYETIDPKTSPNKLFSYVDIGAIDNSVQRITAPKEFLGRDAPSRARRVIKTNDVLFSTVRTYLKNVAQVQQELDGQLTSTGICVLRANEAVDPGYLFRWVGSAAFIDEISQAQDGTMYPAVKDDDVLSGPIPLPPLAEQERIVRKLDTLSARTTTARTHLTAIAKLVEEFRAAILDHVMIQADAKYDWEHSNLEAVRSPEATIRYGVVQPGAISDEGVQLIRVMDMMGGVIAWDQLRRVAPEIDEAYAKARVENDDVLVSVVGTIGRVALVSGLVEQTNIARAVARIRPDKSKVDPKWLSLRLMAADVQARFEGDVREVARKTLNIGLIKETPFKRPPLETQRAIVKTIEAAFSKIDRLADEAEKTLKLTDRLDERILAKAFAGELVPQDPNDEPASVLLERIREARESAPAKKPRRKPRKKTERLMSRKIEEVLAEAGDWLPSQEAFRRCGISDGAETDAIELIYAELRELEQSGRLDVEAVADDQGRKLHDRLKLKAA